MMTIQLVEDYNKMLEYEIPKTDLSTRIRIIWGTFTIPPPITNA